MHLQQDPLARRAACFGLLAAASSGPGQTYFIGLFGAFMRQDFALSEAALGGIYGVATLASGILMFWLGAMADRVALRRAISLAVFLLVAGCVLVAFAIGPLTLCAGLFLLRLVDCAGRAGATGAAIAQVRQCEKFILTGESKCQEAEVHFAGHDCRALIDVPHAILACDAHGRLTGTANGRRQAPVKIKSANLKCASKVCE